MPYVFKPITTDQQIREIIELQRINLTKNLSESEVSSQGFVTVEHEFESLKKMNQLEPGILLEEHGNLGGYCLAMVRNYGTEIPILFNLFRKLDTLPYDGQLLSTYSYIVVGQVCIARKHRGQGLFDKMYAAYRKHLAPNYQMAITEVSGKNVRSLKAHWRVGFKTILEYQNEAGQDWHIILWDWR